MNNSFFEQINSLINKYSPIIVLLTLFGTVSVGGSYLLSINNHIEINNALMNKYYDELISQRSLIESFKDTFHSKNEDVVKKLTKCLTTIDELKIKLSDINIHLITIESRVFDLKNK